MDVALASLNAAQSASAVERDLEARIESLERRIKELERAVFVNKRHATKSRRRHPRVKG